MILIVAAIGLLAAAHQLITRTGPPTKEQWLRQRAARLQVLGAAQRKLAAASPRTPVASGEEWAYYRVPGEAVIPLASGEWVCVACHSWHQNDFSGPNLPLRLVWVRDVRRIRRWLMGAGYPQPVGDAVLAIDQDGRFYVNDGHVCGGLQLGSDRPVHSMEDFLQTRSVPGDGSWRAVGPP